MGFWLGILLATLGWIGVVITLVYISQVQPPEPIEYSGFSKGQATFRVVRRVRVYDWRIDGE